MGATIRGRGVSGCLPCRSHHQHRADPRLVPSRHVPRGLHKIYRRAKITAPSLRFLYVHFLFVLIGTDYLLLLGIQSFPFYSLSGLFQAGLVLVVGDTLQRVNVGTFFSGTGWTDTTCRNILVSDLVIYLDTQLTAPHSFHRGGHRWKPHVHVMKIPAAPCHPAEGAVLADGGQGNLTLNRRESTNIWIALAPLQFWGMIYRRLRWVIWELSLLLRQCCNGLEFRRRVSR